MTAMANSATPVPGPMMAIRRQREEQGRQGEQQIDRAHDERVNGAAVEAREKAEWDADGHRHEHGSDRHAQRDAVGEEHAGENVAPQRVRAERMRSVGAGEHPAGIDRVGVVGSEHRREDRDHHEGREDRGADGRAAVHDPARPRHDRDGAHRSAPSPIRGSSHP